jgi:hypothetical protein
MPMAQLSTGLAPVLSVPAKRPAEMTVAFANTMDRSDTGATNSVAVLVEVDRPPGHALLYLE